MYVIGDVPLYAQSLLHLLIAVNRCTALFAPLSHDLLWSPRIVAGSLAGTFLFAVLLHMVQYFVMTWLSGDPDQWLDGEQVHVS